MIRAAIVGLGRWGRSLVASVSGKSDEIGFVRGVHADARGRRGFLPRAQTPARRQLRGGHSPSRHRRRGARHAAQSARSAGAGRRRRRQARLCRKAADARSQERAPRCRDRQQGGPRAGRRSQPPLSSKLRRTARPRTGWTPRPHRRHGGAAHHIDRAIRPARQLARGARGSAGRRLHGRRHSRARLHDRACRPRARAALRDRTQLSGPLRRYDHASCCNSPAARPA